MILINLLKRKALFLLREILLSFVLIKNNISNIFKNKNLGNKQIVIQEETFSFNKEIDFYTLLLFLSNFKLKRQFSLLRLKCERTLVSFNLCLNLSKILDKSFLLKNKHVSKTNLVY